MNNTAVLLLILLLLGACTLPPTPAPIEAVCTPPTHPFGENGIPAFDWREWDGSELSYSTEGGSTYYLSLENDGIRVDLDPSDGSERRYVNTFQLRVGSPAIVPLATEVSTSTEITWFITGPIMFFQCSDTIMVNDEYKDLRIEIEVIKPDQPFEFPKEWLDPQA